MESISKALACNKVGVLRLDENNLNDAVETFTNKSIKP